MSTHSDKDNNAFRNDFPILRIPIQGKLPVYLDNAATTQKPQCVIDALVNFYTCQNANVHRGLHYLSQKASESYDAARKTVREFLGAAPGYETVFTSGATASINLVAHGFGHTFIHADDEILITQMEHHSNIVPWQLLCRATGAKLRVVPITESGELVMAAFDRLLNERTKIVAVTHVSNVLGTVNPVRDICSKAKSQGAVCLVDGAQSAAHLKIDLQEMGADFFCCSGHKMYGPTGIGVLCGRTELLEAMCPYQTGSGMITTVTFDETTFRNAPEKFEAGTPHIAGAAGLAAAIAYIEGVGMDTIAKHEQDLLQYASEALATIEGLTIRGTATHKSGVISFTMDCAHPHDIAQVLDHGGVAIRSGHHCAQPLMQFYGIPATARASFGLYNTKQDIDTLVQGLHHVRKVFA